MYNIHCTYEQILVQYFANLTDRGKWQLTFCEAPEGPTVAVVELVTVALAAIRPAGRAGLTQARRVHALRVVHVVQNARNTTLTEKLTCHKKDENLTQFFTQFQISIIFSLYPCFA